MNKKNEIFKKLKISKITQIGVVVRDLDKSIDYCENILGLGTFIKPKIKFFNIFYYEKEVKAEWILAFCSMQQFELELIQPIVKPTIYHDFLEEKGEGIHHIGFDVDEIEKKIDICKDYGIKIMQGGERKGGKFAYLDTRAIGGIICELIQRDNKFV